MFTRVARFKLKPEHTHEAMVVTHETIKPALEKIDGVRLMVVTIDRDLGHGSATTIYDSRESAGRAQEILDHIWGFLSVHLQEPPEISEQEMVFWLEDHKVIASTE